MLHAAHVQAHAETYMGLVEVGVGLIPAGGGTKELLGRAMDTLPDAADPAPHVQRVFETIGFARTSTSALDAARIGYLRDRDGVTMNRDRLLADAKAQALVRAGRLSAPSVHAGRSAWAVRRCAPHSISASISRGGPDESATTTSSSEGSSPGS